MRNKKSYKSFIVLATVFMGTMICAQQDKQDFIIKPVKTKKLSINVLKENIGQATKTLFQTTTSMNKQLGSLHIDIAHAQDGFTQTNNHKLAPTVLASSSRISKTFGTLQIEVASLQNKYSDIIEKLVENQAPFKKASRTDLEDALRIIQTVDQTFGKHATICKNMSVYIKTGKAGDILNNFKDIEKKLEQHVVVVKNAHSTMAKNICLK